MSNKNRSNTSGNLNRKRRDKKSHKPSISQPPKNVQFPKPAVNVAFRDIDPSSPKQQITKTPVGHTPTNNKKDKNKNKDSRPTFQFKIGLQVGVGLGECYLQLQKLENSVSKLTNVSDDIKGVMQDISHFDFAGFESSSGTKKLSPSSPMQRPHSTREGVGFSYPPKYQPNTKDRSKSKVIQAQAPQSAPDDISPVDEVLWLAEQIEKWQRDGHKRMLALNKALTNLQIKLEDFDDATQKAQVQFQEQYSSNSSRTELDEAYKRIAGLQGELHNAKVQNSDLTFQIKNLKRAGKDSTNTQQKTKELDSRELALDKDAEAIAKQSESLRLESERLYREREEVRKAKEHWNALLSEQKDNNEDLKKRELEIQAQHRKLLEFHENIADEKKKLHKAKKKLKQKEKGIKNARKISGGSQSPMYAGNGGNYGVVHMGMSGPPSEYAESEITYLSDDQTENQSVNSLSDDEVEQLQEKREQLRHLKLPTDRPY